MTRQIRTYAQTGDAGGGDIVAQVSAQTDRLQQRLRAIERIVVIGSGKGGVGKSLVTANLAAALARRGHRVGVADADLNGPCAARMLGAVRAPLQVTERGVHPAESPTGCVVMSMDLLLVTPDAAVQWREPARAGFVWQSTLEAGALREFLADTDWGRLDYLLVDLPPGTDRMARLLALIPQPSALLLITTPSAAAAAVVARAITHARDAGVRDIALVSNMDGHVCRACGATTPLFDAHAGAALAARTGVPLWATIPFDPALGAGTDDGRPLSAGAAAAPAMQALASLADVLERETRPHDGFVP